MEHEVYATGYRWPWTFYNKTALKPWEEASAGMVVSALGSYSVRMLGVASQLFLEISENFILCWGPDKAFFALNSSHNGFDNSAMFGENLPSWFTIPRNLQSSETDFGISICCMAAILLGSAVMPL